MMKIPMSPAAGSLLHALLARGEIARDRVLLASYRSTEWHSLTFSGERHEIALRIPAPADAIVHRIGSGLADAEFDLPGHFVGDIGIAGEPQIHEDGAISITLEALTIAS